MVNIQHWTIQSGSSNIGTDPSPSASFHGFGKINSQLLPITSSSSNTVTTHDTDHRTCNNNHNYHDRRDVISVVSYNVLLPNSADGWWNYKMYDPVAEENGDVARWSTWDYRRELIRQRLEALDADIVCFQEVAPVSFGDDFAFMRDDLGYDGCEMYRKGRFRPATFWRTNRWTLASPPVHKDRTLLTAFQPTPTPTATTTETTATADLASESTSSPSLELQPPPPPQQPQDNKKGHKGKKKDASAQRPDGHVWYVLNCHLQAGKQGKRRVRQINEGVRAVMTLARKLKRERNPERHAKVVVCGDFNGGAECGAVRYLEDGYVDEHFREDNEPVTSSTKKLPLEQPMTDVMACCADDVRGEGGKKKEPPPTLVVRELISLMCQDHGYDNPKLSDELIDKFTKIYNRLATHTTTTTTTTGSGKNDPSKSNKVMNVQNVQDWLIKINGQVGRGSEFREAAKQMGWKDDKSSSSSRGGGSGGGSSSDSDSPNNGGGGGSAAARIELPKGGLLSLQGFLNVYQNELSHGKFWGIAYDLAVLGEPLDDAGLFEGRYDRMYCSGTSVQPIAVVDVVSDQPCPNAYEPSDHLPVAAAFVAKQ